MELKKILAGFIIICSLFIHVSISMADFAPSGILYYNGRYIASSLFSWDSPSWTADDPGYEHDFFFRNSAYFSSCFTITNLPSGYDDCVTAGIMDPNGPVFSFGSFDANSIRADTYYWGTWYFTGHTFGNVANSSSVSLIAQENESRCPLNRKSVVCMHSIDNRTLWSGWANWNGYPTFVFF